jgi:hypothetical protein
LTGLDGALLTWSRPSCLARAQKLAPMHKHDHDRCVARLTVHRLGLIVH